MNVLGINLMDDKLIEYELCKIYGIGIKLSRKICVSLGFLNKKVSYIKPKLALLIKKLSSILLEYDLRKSISDNIKRLISIKCYRGLRHLYCLPVRGQRTKTNAKTAKRLLKIKND